MEGHDDKVLSDVTALSRQAGINGLINQAVTHLQQGRLEKAERLLQDVLDKQPGHAAGNHYLGLIAGQRGQLDLAERLLARAVKACPDDPRYHMSLGFARYKAGRLDEAITDWEQALRLRPELAEAHYCLGMALCEQKLFAEALAACDQAIARSPADARAHNVRGLALQGLDRPDEAIAAYQRAITCAPDYITAYNNLGNLMREQGNPGEALKVFDRALRLEPLSAELNSNRGITLKDLGRLQEALESCERALRLGLQSAVAHNSRGAVLKELQRFVDALEAYEEAIRLDPDFGQAHINHGNTLLSMAQPGKAETSIRRGLALMPENVVAHSNLLFLLAARARLSPPEMLREEQRWDARHGREGRMHPLPSRVAEAVPGRRLRIGYISPDFRRHAVSYFFEPLLAAHDRDRFEVFCYATHAPHQNDDTTDRLRSFAAHWRDAGSYSDVQLASLVHEDCIDILVDLAGHTAGGRLKVFSYRPAPVQATYLGYCAGTGLEAMDYWITDEVLHPPDTRELAVERIYRLPRCWVCYRPPEAAPDVSPCPSNNSQVVFGSFSNISKLLPEVIETWSRILHELPESRLLLVDKPMADKRTRQYFLDQFARHGIPAGRLLVKHSLPLAEYLALYAMVDIVLDPFPRTGGTITADALWMGVPVVTLAGSRYVERISASKLVALGLEDLVTRSRDEYVGKAVSLANDPGLRSELRASLRHRLQQSSLCDGEGLARAMEDAYRAMWNSHLADVL